MKPKNSPTRYLRNKAVIELYKLIVNTNRYSGNQSIAYIITQIEAPVHYISFRYALQAYINYFKYNKPPVFKSRYRQELYMSFLENCKYFRRICSPGTPASRIVARAIACKAPHFGLDPQQIIKIIKKGLPKNED